MTVGVGGTGMVVGIVVGLVLVVHHHHLRMCCRRYWEIHWVVGVQLQLGVLARTGEAPSRQVSLGVL